MRLLTEILAIHQKRVLLSKHILDIFNTSKKTYGCIKICYELLKQDFSISIGRVQRLMRKLGIKSVHSHKFKPKSQKQDNSNTKRDNILAQQFSANAPNKVWTTDITYIRVANKWSYLCVVIDLFSRKVVAWSLSSSMKTDLVIDTIKKAWIIRNCPMGVLLHSDQCSQYISKALSTFLDTIHFIPSFSRKSYPYDNAPTESFNSILKKEEVNRTHYNSLEQARLALFEYIDGFYNSRRQHSALGYLSPNQFENLYFT